MGQSAAGKKDKNTSRKGAKNAKKDKKKCCSLSFLCVLCAFA
jgi:hypothetical protein